MLEKAGGIANVFLQTNLRAIGASHYRKTFPVIRSIKLDEHILRECEESVSYAGSVGIKRVRWKGD